MADSFGELAWHLAFRSVYMKRAGATGKMRSHCSLQSDSYERKFHALPAWLPSLGFGAI